MTKRFTPPKYRRGQKVTTKDGVTGHILSIMYDSGINWYRVKEKYYAEGEITV